MKTMLVVNVNYGGDDCLIDEVEMHENQYSDSIQLSKLNVFKQNACLRFSLRKELDDNEICDEESK